MIVLVKGFMVLLLEAQLLVPKPRVICKIILRLSHGSSTEELRAQLPVGFARSPSRERALLS